MVRTVLAWLLGVTLFNFVLFVICFYWEVIKGVLGTPYGMFLAFLLIACVVTPVAVPRIINYRKKEGLRKQIQHHKIRQDLEAGQRKEIGIDF
jgi:hypothetical protein